jgi:hypothetical protein
LFLKSRSRLSQIFLSEKLFTKGNIGDFFGGNLYFVCGRFHGDHGTLDILNFGFHIQGLTFQIQYNFLIIQDLSFQLFYFCFGLQYHFGSEGKTYEN